MGSVCPAWRDYDAPGDPVGLGVNETFVEQDRLNPPSWISLREV